MEIWHVFGKWFASCWQVVDIVIVAAKFAQSVNQVGSRNRKYGYEICLPIHF